MSNNDINIKDYESLLDLKLAMNDCGESLAKFVEEVDKYLDQCMEEFEQQKQVIQQQLEEAEERLSEAENDLSDCEKSQEYDDEEKEWYPSCSSEQSRVKSAQERCSKLRSQVEITNKIISDYQYQLDNYRKPSSFTSSGGARAQLEYLANTHTKESGEKLDQITDLVISQYLGRKIAARAEMLEADTREDAFRKGKERLNNISSEEVDIDKVEKFKEAAERVREKQERDFRDLNLAEPDVSMICQYCKRPLPLCICARLRER